MSLSYEPNQDADPNVVWDTTFLSDRDVSSQVPINFVPHPGIHVTPACFGDRRYNTEETQACLSNLLASQIQRYVFDIYWDTINRRFSLCPVEIPDLNATLSGAAAVKPRTVERSHFTKGDLGERQAIGGSNITNATSTTSAPMPKITTVDGYGMVELGPYLCSSDLTLYSATSLFNSYLASTSTTLEAKISLWVLNMHVAATFDAPTSPRTNLSSEQLPSPDESVRVYFGQLDGVLYKPTMLATDRANLNASWYRVSDSADIPQMDYYTTETLDDGNLASSDGWPDEAYVQDSRGKRMLVGFGEIDKAFGNYNEAMEGDRIYTQGYLSASRSVTFTPNGTLENGCFYRPDTFDVAQINNSWAVTTISQIDPPNLGFLADNLTVCGISPVLNTSINNSLADTSPIPYQVFGNQAIFSWAYGQPLNDSSVGADADDKFRCALMVSSNAYRGHWQVEYCSRSYHAACRVNGEPYQWTISSSSVPYGSGDAACTGNSTFDVPRTGLENTYLYWHIQSEARADDSLLSGVWINFNSLDYESCWVTTGVNGECPYLQDQDATHSRQILIPTIAALIVLILTVLTILVKCTTNRRNSKARKRGEGGWDYEGIPS